MSFSINTMGEYVLDLNLPYKIAEIFCDDPDGIPIRYRGAYGGRGSGKSFGFADMLISKTLQAPTRALCTRELQTSIKESVLQTLIDRIEYHGLHQFYDYGESYLKSSLWGEDFVFRGLRHNYQEIKSMQGIKICWIEEAELTSEASLRVLDPTLRSGSELWFTWNPENSDSPVNVRYVKNPPENAKIVKVNHSDNPWFPEELEILRLQDQKRDPDVYAHVWEGECLTRTDAQVLGGKWRVDNFKMPPAEELDGGPYYGCDWGFSSDPLAIIRCWIKGNRLYIDQEAGGKGIEIKDTPAEFDKIPGIKKHVVRADNARPEMISNMQLEGYLCVGAEKWPGSIEDGITHLRSYDEIVIHERCVNTAKEARLWSYKIDKQTGDILPVLIDANNHCFVGDTLIETNKGQVRISDIKIGDMVLTRFGFRKVTKTFDNGLKIVKEFKFPNRKSLTATDTHEIITIDGKKYIKDVTTRDTLYFQRGDSCRFFKAKKTRRSYLTAFLIDVIRQAKGEATGFISGVLDARQLVGKHNISTLQFGKKNTDLFRTGLKSTTKTMTPSIMTLITWISGKGRCIGRTMESYAKKPTRVGQKGISTELGISPLIGTGAKKAGHGIENTLKTLLRTLSQKILSANGAAKHSLEIFLLELLSSVPMLVNLHSGGSLGQTMKRECARTAMISSQRTNTQIPSAVRGHAHNRIARVYDISVEEHHEYFANGILVSNCMDAVRYALAPLIKKKNFTGKPVYAGQYNEALHISREELWPVKGLPIIVGLSFEGTTNVAVIAQVSRRGQLRVIEEMIVRDIGVSQFGKTILKPTMAGKYRGCPPTFVFFRGKANSSGRTVDTDSRMLIDEMEEAGIYVESVGSDLLARRTEAVRWYFSQLSAGLPAISISPSCRVIHDGLQGAYQFKSLPMEGGDLRYATDPEPGQYILPHKALQYVCQWMRNDQEDNQNQPVISGHRVYA